MSCNLFVCFSISLFQKHVFEIFRWGIIPLDFVGFLFRTSKSKNDNEVTLNTSFHIDLERFVGD